VSYQESSEQEGEYVAVMYLVHLKGASVKANSYHALLYVYVTAVLTITMKTPAHQ